MERFASALIPDFQQFYSLRFSQVVLDWHPVEIITLITGLPSESRFMARLVGDEGAGWPSWVPVLFDMRNCVEGIRAGLSKKAKFYEFPHWPGKELEKRRQAAKKLSDLKSSLRVAGGVKAVT